MGGAPGSFARLGVNGLGFGAPSCTRLDVNAGFGEHLVAICSGAPNAPVILAGSLHCVGPGTPTPTGNVLSLDLSTVTWLVDGISGGQLGTPVWNFQTTEATGNLRLSIAFLPPGLRIALQGGVLDPASPTGLNLSQSIDLNVL